MKLPIQLVLCFCVACIAGYLAEKVSAPSEDKVNSELTALEKKYSSEITEMTDEYNQKDRSHLATLKQLEQELAACKGADKMEKVFPVDKDIVRKYRVTLIDWRDYDVSDTIVKLLRITPEQKEKMDASVWRAWVAMAEHEAKNAVIRKSPDGAKIEIRVRPFPSGAKAIKKQLEKELSSILDKDRASFVTEKLCSYSSYLSFWKDGAEPPSYRMERSASNPSRWIFYFRKEKQKRTIPPAGLGRFYDELPPEVQKLIGPTDRRPKLPEAAETEK